jgi:DNA repair protein RadC
MRSAAKGPTVFWGIGCGSPWFFAAPRGRIGSSLYGSTIVEHARKKRQEGGEFAMADYPHPSDKLIDQGPGSLTDAEVLSILIATGIPGKSALEIAEDTLRLFGSLERICNQPLERFLQVKGLGDAKIVRIAAAYELAYRLTGLSKNRGS